MLLLSF